jgi:branched-subunit amino acid aminotransferase/4-amino-4-deoxychorismate lyase
MNDLFAHFIWFNGQIIEQSSCPQESLINRVSRRVSLFERFWCASTEIIFPGQVYKKIALQMADYGLKLQYLESETRFANEVQRLLVRNRAYRYSILHLLVGVVDDVQPFEMLWVEPRTEHPAVGRERFQVDVIECASLPTEAVFQLPAVVNPLLHVMQREADAENLDDGIVLNNNGFVARALSGSLFALMANNRVFTPSVQAGAPIDIVRSFVMLTLRRNAYEVVETEEFHLELFDKATEVFSVGIENGCSAIRGVRDNRYFDRLRKRVVSELY